MILCSACPVVGSLSELLPLLSQRSSQLRRLTIDRTRHWDDSVGNDKVEIKEDGKLLLVELGEASNPRLFLGVVLSLLNKCSVSDLEIGFWCRGPVDIDDVLEALESANASAPVRSIQFYFLEHTGIDWMRYLRCHNLRTLLLRHQHLKMLSLPMAELWVEDFEHAHLRELELSWLGEAPMGPNNPNDYKKPAHGSGLEFLRCAQLPKLQRLAIDLQYDWYVEWTPADIEAVFQATLPHLRRLELRYGCDGDAICSALVTCMYAKQLEVIDLTGCAIGDQGLTTLIAGRPVFSSLEKLILLQDGSDLLWAQLKQAYCVEEPD